MSGRRVRRGFTAVELIVVLFLVGMLFALAWPAIMEARETAQRTQCRTNLFQIGLALHNDCFVTSTTVGRGDVGGNLSSSPGWNRNWV